MGAGDRRLFFALWPDGNLRREIVVRASPFESAIRSASRSARPVPVHNLHLTLVFLGTVPADRVDRLISRAAAVRSPAFELLLDRFGTFPRARVAWLGGPAPAAGSALVAALRSACGDCGLDIDDRPWRPHVTLFRGVSARGAAADGPGAETLPGPAIHWPVTEFALVESIPSRPYQVLRSWPLE